MILLFYNLALVAALVAGLPWWLWRMTTAAKYRAGLRERLGWVPPWLRSRAVTKPVVWMHAVSVGEVLAVSRLVSELDLALPQMQVLVSTTTRTGQALARERLGPDRVFYCPLDLPWAVRAYLNALRPRMLVLAETEFWPNMLSGCFKRGVPVAVVNARISDRSWPRYLKLRLLWQPFLSRLSCVLAQSEVDAERLCTIGCTPEQVAVSGNLKFDVRAAQEAEATRLIRTLAPGMRVVVAGSTLEGEEAALLAAWPKLLAQDPNLLLVLAPRHPERFEAVASLLRGSGMQWTRRAGWKDDERSDHAPLDAGSVVLLDTIGELASLYSLAAVAFVGGSIAAGGGHNPLEPAQFGVPIVMGPHTHNFRAMVQELLAHDAMRVAGKDELAATLAELLRDRGAAVAMGHRAREVFEAQAGATARSVEALRVLLEGGA